ncbi:MAG: hypothetical protein IKE35_04610, partial [Lachnospiraceae bacterium]|nr:hypothetical protein [Lachnospiraceae bacterium]
TVQRTPCLIIVFYLYIQKRQKLITAYEILVYRKDFFELDNGQILAVLITVIKSLVELLDRLVDRIKP